MPITETFCISLNQKKPLESTSQRLFLHGTFYFYIRKSNFKNNNMKVRNTSAVLLMGLMMGACAGSGYQRTENGVIVKVDQQQPTDVRMIRVEVLGDKLIHVSATPEKKFSEEKSLIIVPQTKKTDFKVEDKEGEVTVKTARLCAVVSKTTGQVRFTDAADKPILSEDKRSFTPIEVEGTKGYTVRQVFQSTADEAFMAWDSISPMNSITREK